MSGCTDPPNQQGKKEEIRKVREGDMVFVEERPRKLSKGYVVGPGKVIVSVFD